MSGCSCENYTHPGDCDYCKGFKDGAEEVLKQLKQLEENIKKQNRRGHNNG